MHITTLDSDLAFFARVTASRGNPVQQGATARAEAAPRGERAAVPQESLRDAVETINARLELAQRAVRVVPRGDSGSTVIEVIDSETDQVIRQIPPDNALKLAAWFKENGMLSDHVQGGFALDETA